MKTYWYEVRDVTPRETDFIAARDDAALGRLDLNRLLDGNPNIYRAEYAMLGCWATRFNLLFKVF